MRKAFEANPVHDLTPADAYRCIVKKEVESVELRNIDPDAATPQIAGVMLVPYPPGIPIMIIERTAPDENGNKYFRIC